MGVVRVLVAGVVVVVVVGVGVLRMRSVRDFRRGATVKALTKKVRPVRAGGVVSAFSLVMATVMRKVGGVDGGGFSGVFVGWMVRV